MIYFVYLECKSINLLITLIIALFFLIINEIFKKGTDFLLSDFNDIFDYDIGTVMLHNEVGIVIRNGPRTDMFFF